MVPFEKQSITVIRQSKVGVDTSYEPPLRVGFGVSDKTVDGANAVMGRTVLIPGAEPIWTQTIERSAEDIGDLMYATPYQYTMRHRFPKPPGV